MNALGPFILIVLFGGPLAFALGRIAIRLRQDPTLAALAGVLIIWHMLALWQGGVLLASAVLLLIGVSAILILAQWLKREGVAGRPVQWGLTLAALGGLAIAMRIPALDPDQALLFGAGYGVAGIATWCAAVSARNPVSMGKSGLPALGLMGVWLIVRAAACMIAAPE